MNYTKLAADVVISNGAAKKRGRPWGALGKTSLPVALEQPVKARSPISASPSPGMVSAPTKPAESQPTPAHLVSGPR